MIILVYSLIIIYIYIYKNEAKSLKPNPADIEASSKGPKLVHGFP
jgi:hypothetical protein